MDPELTDTLAKRLSPVIQTIKHTHIDESEYYDFVGDQYGVPSGDYVPVGINPFLRVSKYEANFKDCFQVHTDSCYCRNDQYVGFWTVLLSLNDDFEGGETTIYSDDYRLVHTVTPQVGQVFCFYHYHLHAGLYVQTNSKYVVRTEIMFARHNDDSMSLQP